MTEYKTVITALIGLRSPCIHATQLRLLYMTRTSEGNTLSPTLSVSQKHRSPLGKRSPLRKTLKSMTRTKILSSTLSVSRSPKQRSPLGTCSLLGNSSQQTQTPTPKGSSISPTLTGTQRSPLGTKGKRSPLKKRVYRSLFGKTFPLIETPTDVSSTVPQLTITAVSEQGKQEPKKSKRKGKQEPKKSKRKSKQEEGV